jgi:hypothetical protein
MDPLLQTTNCPPNKGSKKRSRHSKKRRGPVSKLFTWLIDNPDKILGIMFACIFIYITVLFIQYDSVNGKRGPSTAMEIKNK